jgi:hypothetical protein
MSRHRFPGFNQENSPKNQAGLFESVSKWENFVRHLDADADDQAVHPALCPWPGFC